MKRRGRASQWGLLGRKPASSSYAAGPFYWAKECLSIIWGMQGLNRGMIYGTIQAWARVAQTKFDGSSGNGILHTVTKSSVGGRSTIMLIKNPNLHGSGHGEKPILRSTNNAEDHATALASSGQLNCLEANARIAVGSSPDGPKSLISITVIPARSSRSQRVCCAGLGTYS